MNGYVTVFAVALLAFVAAAQEFPDFLTNASPADKAKFKQLEKTATSAQQFDQLMSGWLNSRPDLKSKAEASAQRSANQFESGLSGAEAALHNQLKAAKSEAEFNSIVARLRSNPANAAALAKLLGPNKQG